MSPQQSDSDGGFRPDDVVAIAAVASNGVIGADGDIPWRIAEDWARFKRLTQGHALVMGRRTYESIGRPLPGRLSVVVTRNRDWRPNDAGGRVQRCDSVEAAIALGRRFRPDGPVFVAGGAEIYRAALPFTTVLELTEVHAEPDGDTRFPSWQQADWRLDQRDERDGFAFARYRRTTSAARPGGVDGSPPS